MDEAVKTAPGFFDFGKDVGDVFILADVAFIHHIAAQLLCKGGNAIFETLSDIGECQFGAFTPARFCDAKGNGTVR